MKEKLKRETKRFLTVRRSITFAVCLHKFWSKRVVRKSTLPKSDRQLVSMFLSFDVLVVLYVFVL